MEDAGTCQWPTGRNMVHREWHSIDAVTDGILIYKRLRKEKREERKENGSYGPLHGEKDTEHHHL